MLRHLLSSTASAIAAVAAATCLVNVGSAVAAPPVAYSGAYVGWGNAAGLSSFGTWRGAKSTVALDYLGDSSWSNFENESSMFAGWKPFVQGGGRFVLDVPMVTQSGTTFSAGAAGAYDQYFTRVGDDLVSDGLGNTVINLGAEFNGSWNPWSIQPGSTSMGTAAFIADYQHIVTLFRSIPGADFTFGWTVSPGRTQTDASTAYPGNAYVDYVGVDLYDRGWAADGGPISDPATRWAQVSGSEWGLNWWLSFAEAHGKPIALPEWGLNNAASQNGGGDDPYFIEQMYSWMQTNHPAFESYFNDGDNIINPATAPSTSSDPTDPQAAAEYQKLWGASAGTQAPVVTQTPVATPGPVHRHPIFATIARAHRTGTAHRARSHRAHARRGTHTDGHSRRHAGRRHDARRGHRAGARG